MDPKFIDLAHSVIKVCEEAAKLTGNTWDDVVVDAIHQTFDKWFGIVHSVRNAPGDSTTGGVVLAATSLCHESVVTVVNMPAWLATLLQKLLPFILDMFTKVETALKIDPK